MATKILSRSKAIKKESQKHTPEGKSRVMKKLTELFQQFKKKYNSEIVKIYKDTKGLLQQYENRLRQYDIELESSSADEDDDEEGEEESSQNNEPEKSSK